MCTAARIVYTIPLITGIHQIAKWNQKHWDEATTLSSQSCCRLWWRLWQQIPLPLSWHRGQSLQFLVPVKLFQFPVQMLRGEGCSLLDDRCQRFSPSGLLSWCVQQCTTDVHPAQWVDTSRTRSPAAANNEAASPEPEDDRIAREVLNFKLSGAIQYIQPSAVHVHSRLVLFILYHLLLEYIR